MKSGRWIVLALAVLSLVSCVRPDEVALLSVDRVQVEGTSRAAVTVTAENRSGHNIRLLSANLTLWMGEATLLRVLLPQAVTLERHSAGQVEIPLRLRMTDPMAGLSLERMLVEQTELFAVSGDLVVCAGWGRKKIKLERVPLNQILATFGANPEELKKLWE